MFNATSIPVLEQVVGFAQARHGVLAGNLANLDTPGYRGRDLSPMEFEQRLAEAIRAGDTSDPMFSQGLAEFAPEETQLQNVAASMQSILYHDESDVSLEHQVAEISKNQALHNLALTIMTQQFRLLEGAISERVA